jgi:hypothetical protein
MTDNTDRTFDVNKTIVRGYHGKTVKPQDGKTRVLTAPTPSAPLIRLGLATERVGAPFYDPRAADIMANISGWAYSDYAVLMDALARRGIVDDQATCSQVSVKNEAMLVVSTAFLIRTGNVGVLCFRGTEPTNAINFLTDASCKPINFFSMGKVHGGFFRNVAAVWPELVMETEAAIASGLDALYITGHSLGAAMAVVAAATIFGDSEYADWRPLVRGVYTYGQPMVGDHEFARSCERLQDRVFRHVYGHDLVSRLPPRSAGTFTHFGHELHGSDTGWSPRSRIATQVTSIAMSLPIAALAWAFQQLPFLSWVPLPLSVDDHSPNNYLEAFRVARS